MNDDKGTADNSDMSQRWPEYAAAAPTVVALASEAAKLLAGTKGALNYVEYGLHSPETGLWSLTMRRENGETPGRQCARLTTEVAAQRARADKAITALREVRRLCAAFEDLENTRSSVELLDAIHDAAIQALGDLQ